MDNDTIAAIATPFGEGGIGIVRISGPRSEKIALKLFKTKKGSLLKSHYLYYGEIINPRNNEVVDEVLLSIMRAPRSYTREDSVEINCHGGRQVLREILNLTLQEGARLPTPGEFTKRAFVNGRIDLTQAEAVVGLIKAETTSGLALASRQLKGKVSDKIKKIKKNVLSAAGLIEVLIDFSEEDIEETDGTSLYTAIKENISSAIEKASNLLSTYQDGKIYQAGVGLVVAGGPNVGKSSLINILLGEERVIVSPVAGTTRDVVEENININGIPLRVADTAGIHPSNDIIIETGCRLALEKIKQSDLVVLVIDSNKTVEENTLLSNNAFSFLLNQKKLIIALNKIDLDFKINIGFLKKIFPSGKIVKISVLCDKGIDKLKEVVVASVAARSIGEGSEPIIFLIRHKLALEKIISDLEKAGKLIKEKRLEFVAFELRKALDVLGEIIGETTTEDILENIFSQFCIGK